MHGAGVGRMQATRTDDGLEDSSCLVSIVSRIGSRLGGVTTPEILHIFLLLPSYVHSVDDFCHRSDYWDLVNHPPYQSPLREMASDILLTFKDRE
jgi:hypothetical protein